MSESIQPKPRVLFIASQPFFEWRGSPIRLGFNLLALSQLGYEVDFLTLPLGEDRSIEGVEIIRAPNVIFAKRISIGPSFAKLVFDFLLFWMGLGRIMRHRYEVIHGVEDCGLIAWFLARMSRKSFIFERHSDPTSHRKGRGRNMVMRIYAAVERFVMRQADAVIGTGPGLVEHAREVGRASRACLIPDIPSSLAGADERGKAAARALCQRNPNDILITYVGSFAVYQGIDLLFASIPIVTRQEPRARFVVIGGSPSEISQRKEELGRENAVEATLFLGGIHPDELPNYLGASDILLSPRISGMNTPLKLLDYLKAEAAIVATNCEANRLILDSSTAYLTEARPEDFAAGILELCRNEQRRSQLGEKGAELIATTHNFEHFKKSISQCYRYVADVG